MAIVFGLAKREFLFNAKIKKKYKIIIDKENEIITTTRMTGEESKRGTVTARSANELVELRLLVRIG